MANSFKNLQNKLERLKKELTTSEPDAVIEPQRLICACVCSPSETNNANKILFIFLLLF